jgi:hypothetical protein
MHKFQVSLTDSIADNVLGPKRPNKQHAPEGAPRRS